MSRQHRYRLRPAAEVLALLQSVHDRAGRLNAMERLYLRDQATCWLCAGLVTWGLPIDHPDAATVDHVIPKSHGGPGTPGNTRLAHRRCNIARGDRPNGHPSGIATEATPQ